MSELTDRIARDRFADLPGGPRRTGIEIEFSGLSEREAATVVADTVGGKVVQNGPHDFAVEGSEIGPLKIYLDTALRDSVSGELGRAALDLSRQIVPVEMVTAPLAAAELPNAETLFTALRQAGATGTGGGMLLGFGLHLNPEIADDGLDHLSGVLTAYALAEDWLRYGDPMDSARRLLPFSDPYPRDFVDRLASAPVPSRAALFAAYLDANPTRNRGLDLMPIIEELEPGLIRELTGEKGAKSARPTWHYRLPDSRIDVPDWTLAYEWNRWVTIERLARDTQLRDDLACRWLAYRDALTSTRTDWLNELENVLASSGILPE